MDLKIDVIGSTFLMSTTASIASNYPTHSQTSAQKSPSTFEFTKRKRWADLLAAELVDAVTFILSPTSKILYCGASVTELLGWRSSDLIDCDFTDFIRYAEQDDFLRNFRQCLEANFEILLQVHLRCRESLPALPSTPREVLFELKGYSHYILEHGTDCTCVLMVAKPLISRNTTTLRTYIELTVENERLKSKVEGLKSIVASQPALPEPPSSTVNSMYATSMMGPPMVPPTSVDPPTSYYIASNLSTSTLGDTKGTKDYSADSLHDSESIPTSSSTDDDVGDGAKRKKLKKGLGAEQYVCITCGRTDSPEWRKGPLGPKTLCNACGLRWAKQVRKVDEPGDGSAASC